MKALLTWFTLNIGFWYERLDHVRISQACMHACMCMRVLGMYQKFHVETNNTKILCASFLFSTNCQTKTPWANDFAHSIVSKVRVCNPSADRRTCAQYCTFLCRHGGCNVWKEGRIGLALDVTVVTNSWEKKRKKLIHCTMNLPETRSCGIAGPTDEGNLWREQQQ